MNKGVLCAVGKTPLVALTRLPENIRFRVFAKLEGLNAGGSIKDRAAVNIIEQGMAEGLIEPRTVVIESSSGNMGIGLAQVCAFFKLRFICVVDPKTTKQNIAILKAYGAEIEMISEPDQKTGEFLQARINRVTTLLHSFENTFWPNQYSNLHNSNAHLRTMEEIVTELEGRLDYLFCAASTCGTIRGCADYAREHKLPTKIIAVDAIGSVIFGGQQAKRLIPGHGAAIQPALYRPDLANRFIHVSDLDSVVGCRRLVRHEAILAGGSSGAVLMALESIKHEIPDEATCVLILPDRGERYLDTIYSDSWIEDNFGDVSHLWSENKGCQFYQTVNY